MAVTAELLVVTPDTALLVVFGLDGVDADKITTVIFGHIVALKRLFTQFYINTATSVAIITE